MGPLRAITVAALVAAVGAAPAHGAAVRARLGGVTLVLPSGGPATDAQTVADESRVATPIVRVTAHVDEDCPELGGGDCEVDGRQPAIYVAFGGPPFDIQTRLELMHEIGHVWDSRVLARERGMRAKFARALHRAGPWWGLKSDDSPPGEQFAVSYSFCATGAPLRLLREFSYYDYHPTFAEQAHVCALIARASASTRRAGTAGAP